MRNRWAEHIFWQFFVMITFCIQVPSKKEQQGVGVYFLVKNLKVNITCCQ